MEASPQPLSPTLQGLVADLERVIHFEQNRAAEMEKAATGGTGRRSDVQDWGLWGKAHATRRVADRLLEVLQKWLAEAEESTSEPLPGPTFRSAREVIQALIDAEANSVLREALVRALGREVGGTPFLQRIAQRDESYAVRRAAVAALADKPEANTLLGEIAGNRAYDPLARCKAIELLGQKAGSEPVLTHLLRNEKVETIREATVRALAHQDMPAEFFLELLRDASEWVRLAALKALGGRSVTAGVFQDLACHDLNRAVRLASLDLAIERGAPIPFLQKVAGEDKDESVRLRAKQALAKLTPPTGRRGFWPFSRR